MRFRQLDDLELWRVRGQILAHDFRCHGNSPDVAVLSNGHGIAQSANTFDLDRVAVGHRLPGFSKPKRRAHTPSIKTVVMDLLTERARSACLYADRSTHPPH